MSVLAPPLVSVVTPAHNAQEFLASSVHSVLRQSHENLELIICDDGSSDSTWTIISQLCETDARIKAIQHISAKGAGAARNACMDASRGEYIAFLDADDMWAADKLTQQLNYMNENEADFVFSHYRTFKDHLTEDNTGIVIDSHWAGKFAYGDLLWKRANLGCLTVLCKASLINDKRMTHVKSGQDYAFWLELLKATDKAYCFPEVTASYRVGHSSLSANKIKKIKNIFSVFRHQENYSVPYCVLLCVNYSVMTTILAMKSKLRTKIYR